jgi:hypothetical protein
MKDMIMHKKAQAVVELALFGSLILFIFGLLLSYAQRFNDQQYVHMETFRRALQRANSGQGNESGAGASVQFTFIENRKHIDLQAGFRKGNTQTLSSSSSVFWAVPEVGGRAQNLIVYKVNEDENIHDFRNFVPEEHDRFDREGNERQRFWSFEPEDMSTDSKTHFKEALGKKENTEAITNTAISEISEGIHTKIPYRVVEKDKDDENYEAQVSNGMLVDFNQHLFRDTDGQYKFSSNAPDLPVIRKKEWKTEF